MTYVGKNYPPTMILADHFIPVNTPCNHNLVKYFVKQQLNWGPILGVNSVVDSAVDLAVDSAVKSAVESAVNLLSLIHI